MNTCNSPKTKTTFFLFSKNGAALRTGCLERFPSFTEIMVLVKTATNQGVAWKPRYHYKSIGRQLVLLVSVLKPHMHLLQGPNMKSYFIEFMNSFLCCS